MRLEWIEDLPDMWKATYDLVAQVPEGKVTTYGEVARALGDTVASRFVGLAMSMNEDILRVPCRRVVQSDGFVGGYTPGGPGKKSRLLRGEGVDVRNGFVADLEKIMFRGFETTYPLREVRDIQRRLRKHLLVKRLNEKIVTVAGIDVAYEGELGFAAMVSLDAESHEAVDTKLVKGRARFPYIPTYLAFREIPVIRPLLKCIPSGTVLMYDGNGILHPLGFGIASQLGVAFDVPTIGVAKKLLCGKVSKRSVQGAYPVLCNGSIAGHALAKTARSRPIFASVGHRVSREQAVGIAREFLDFRVPEPVRLAHIAAEGARRGRNKK